MPHTYTAEYFISWESSNIRKYLNEVFIKNFDAESQGRIAETLVLADERSRSEMSELLDQLLGISNNDTTDKFFILSISETLKYFGDSGKTDEIFENFGVDDFFDYYVNDNFNMARSTTNSGGAASSWWLRSAGLFSSSTAYVTSDGRINLLGDSGGRMQGGVRPALWLMLN
jgi:hypothetical protein